MDFKFVKIVTFVPLSHAKKVRQAFAQAGAGHIGNYDYCSFSSLGTGRFRPMKGAKPFIGETNKIEEVKEERIEVICRMKILDTVLKAVRVAHPYEEPVIDVYPLLNTF